MNIKTILMQIPDNKEICDKYDIDRDRLTGFLNVNWNIDSDKTNAYDLIAEVMKYNGKGTLVEYIIELGRVEYGTLELSPKARDHIIHAINVFILGIYLNERILATNIAVNDLEWKIASLFHDIGYPLQIAGSICSSFEKVIKKVKNDSSDDLYLSMSMQLQKLTRLSAARDSFEIIFKRLEEWNIDVEAIEEYVFKDRVCDHGVYSALVLLNYIDALYYKNNKKREKRNIPIPGTEIYCNQETFDNNIVSACSAIFLHNLPNKCFNNLKIKREIAPAAFLLKLTDTLQDWGRPSIKYPNGISPSHFDIFINDDKLTLQIKLPKEKEKKSKLREELLERESNIRKDIKGCLDAGDIFITAE